MKDAFFRKYEKIIGSDNLDLTSDPPVFYPSSEDVLCEIVHNIHSDKLKIRITGKRTYPVPESGNNVVLLSTTALSTVKEINIDDFLIIVQAGVIVDDAANAAEKFGLYMPLDITSGDRATMGGAYMSGAVGPCMTGYGAFSESIIGVKCVNARGDTVTFGGRTTKNVTGYDVTRFLSGTMGMYALATELIIKVNPFPESRLMIVARFLPRSRPFDTVTSIISNVKNVKRFELIANEGLGGKIIIGIGFEGLDSIVQKNAHLVQNIMRNARAEDILIESYKQFMKMRRKVAKQMVGRGFYTFLVPPVSSGIFMKRIKSVSPEIPVIAHLKTGRFHIVCNDDSRLIKLRESGLAIGGKLPVEWEHLNKKGIRSLFTEDELSIARSLKRDLDPLEIFNPHLKLL